METTAEEILAKTRLDELEDILNPGGQLNRDIYATILKIRHAETEDEVDKLLETFDCTVNKYLAYSIEYDRLTRREGNA